MERHDNLSTRKQNINNKNRRNEIYPCPYKEAVATGVFFLLKNGLLNIFDTLCSCILLTNFEPSSCYSLEI